MKELVEKLYKNCDVFNYDVVQEIRNNKGPINDYLLAELDKNIKNYNNQNFPILVDYVLFLLAEFKEKKAFPLIIKMLSIPNLSGFDNLDPGILDKLANIIASVFDGNFKQLNKLIENKDIDTIIRGSVLETYIYFYNNDLISKEELIKFLRKIISLYNYEDYIYNSILTVIIKTHLKEMIPDAKEMFDNDAIEYEIQGGYPEFIDYLFDYQKRTYDEVTEITNIEDNMAWWDYFRKDKNVKNFYAKKIDQEIKEKHANNIINYNKVGRNDPCPCGSGKKYKKCCLNKIERGLPYQYYIDKSLENYPKKNNNSNELDFYSLYDEDAINIDKLLYQALKKKNIPLFIKRNREKEREINYKYLDEAYPLIKEIIKKKKIKTIEDYDEKVSIHFSLYLFFIEYMNMLIVNINNGENLKKFEEIINYVYSTFEINEKKEYIFLEFIDTYYLFTKKYKEAIKFFESKLSNKYTKDDVYNYLFYLYYIAYENDGYVKKMNLMIENETDEDLKETLVNLKNYYIDEEE